MSAPDQTGQGVEQHLERFLSTLGGVPALVVGYSGGPDSQALLVGLVRVAGRRAAAVKPRAVHVNHGLHPMAGRWAEHCARSCERLGVDLQVLEVDASARRGESPEEGARRVRLAALQGSLSGGERLVLAHTVDDQIETLLLRLLRGSGPRGLAAMAASRPLGRHQVSRPLLALSREAVLEYLASLGEPYVVDPGNEDGRLERSYLRNRVLPLLRARWPGLVRTLPRAAQLQAETAGLLEVLGDLDLATLDRDASTLDCRGLRELWDRDPARGRNALRRWLSRHGARAPSREKLSTVRSQVLDARPDAAPSLEWDGHALRRYRDRLHYLPSAAAPGTWSELWHPPRVLELAHGRLCASPRRGSGLASCRVPEQGLLVRSRRGGEHCRLPGRAGSRSLKKLLQEWGVPPWERAALPLVFAGDTLAAVPGHCVCEGFAAGPGECGWELSFQPCVAPG